MSSSPKAPKAPVVIYAPKLISAWTSLCSITSNSDAINAGAINLLAVEVRDSQLTVREMQKIIRDSGSVSSLVKVSHVEGLPTWLILREDQEFLALDLDKQLSSAVSAYKLLGVKTAQSLPTFSAVAKATKAARAVKNGKKAATPISPKAKAKATNAETLQEILGYLMALNLSTLSDDEHDLFAELCILVDSKAVAFNETALV